VTSPPLRVVVGEDQPLVRAGIVRALEEEEGFEVVAVAADAPDLVRKARAHKPDVVVTDIQMPPDLTDDGLRAAIEIRATQPEVGVVVLSQFLEERYALDLVGERADGVGYLLKDRVGDVRQFIDAIRQVAAGGTVIDPEVVAQLLRRRDNLAALTPREQDVLRLMAEGRSNAAIAAGMVITEKAVSNYINALFAKLGLPPSGSDHRRVLAVLTYLDQ
jgi:DNA-binding NarL/FixJ family response regulator